MIGCAMLKIVFLWRALLRVLVALSVMALLAVPVAASAIDATMTSSSHAAMAGDMPCCPDVPMAPDCAKLCAIMTVCVASGLVHAAGAAGIAPAQTAALRLVGAADATWRGTIVRPPPKPPKS